MLWGKKSNPIIHAYNFALSGFAMLAPLAARPFLGGAHRVANGTLPQDSIEVNRSSIDIPKAVEITNVTELYDGPLSRTFYPCLIVSLPLLVLAFLRLITFIPERKQILTQKIQAKQLPVVSEKSQIGKVQRIVLCVLFFFAGISSGAIEVIWAGFSPGYATKYHSWTMQKASMIPFTYWLLSTIGRFIFVPIAKLVEPPRILTVSNVTLLVTSVMLIILGESHATTFLVCCGITAVFCAPLIASGVSWTCNTLGVSGLNSSLFLAGNSLGATLSPVITARLCEAYGASLFSWTGFGINALMLASIVSICSMKRLWRPIDAQQQANFEVKLTAQTSESEI